jgi:hypothetical protein
MYMPWRLPENIFGIIGGFLLFFMQCWEFAIGIVMMPIQIRIRIGIKTMPIHMRI